jgi:hypothetical protein
MGLGIGGATPFHMSSNHQTAFNHSFRDTVGYDPSKQVRVKCWFCGCWAKKGKLCYHCHRFQGKAPAALHDIIPPRPSTTSARNSARSLTPRSGSTGTRTRSNSAQRSHVPDNALTHCFRDTSGYDPAARLKVKCSFCGCWSRRGTHCGFCKTFNK